MRVAQWPDVLNAQIEAVRHEPFAWGTWDCCQFCAQIVSALTGEDHRDLFPIYASEEEAQVILAEIGGMQKLIERALGPAKPVAFAQRGDIVMIDIGLGFQPAVCLGVECTAPGPKGLRFAPTRLAEAAWTV